MANDPQSNSKLDLPTGLAIAAIASIILACLISGPTYLPCQQPQQRSAYQQTGPQGTATNTQQPSSDQTAQQCDDKAPDWWMVRLTFLIILVSAAQLWMFYRQWRVMHHSLTGCFAAAAMAISVGAGFNQTPNQNPTGWSSETQAGGIATALANAQPMVQPEASFHSHTHNHSHTKNFSWLNGGLKCRPGFRGLRALRTRWAAFWLRSGLWAIPANSHAEIAR